MGDKDHGKLLAELRAAAKAGKGFEEKYGVFKMNVLTLPLVYEEPSPKQTAMCLTNRSLALAGFETAILYYAKINEEVNLLKNFELARNFYFDPVLKTKLASDKNFHKLDVVSLELLSLLVAQKFSEFYSLVERLDFNERESQTIKFVLELERCLMEGNYAQLLAELNQPKKNEFFELQAPFLKKLEGTVQREIGSCVEKAYLEVGDKDISRMFNMKNKDALEKNVFDGWLKVGGKYRFNNSNLDNKLVFDKSKKEGIIAANLKFAAELEQIV